MTETTPDKEKMSSEKETVTKKESTETEGESKTETSKKKGETKLVLTTTCEFDQLSFKNDYKQLLFMTTIKAPYFRPESRAPVDLVCIVDESGSMEGERIKLVKVTMEFVIKNLESNDRFGCIGYSDGARSILELTKMDTTGKEKAIEAVKSIRARGSTALCAGLLAGLSMMRNRKEGSSVASAMLFTDGQANIGPTTAQQIIQAISGKSSSNSFNSASYRNMRPTRQMPPQTQGLVQQKNVQQNYQPNFQLNNLSNIQSNIQMNNIQNNQQPGMQQIIQQPLQQQPGALVIGEKDEVLEEEEKTKTEEGSKDVLPCTINTFGFGEGHNETLLQALAEHGRGMYAFIKTTDMISETFAECLGGLVSVVAQDLTLRLETLNDVKINKCLSSGLNIKVVDANRRYEVTFADIQSEESRDIVFQLDVPAVLEPKSDWPLAQVYCSYKNVILGINDQMSTVASVARVESGETGERNYALDLQNNRLVAADAMIEADKLANGGKLKEARERLDNAQKQIKNSRTNKDKYSEGLIQDIQQCASGLRDENEYRNHGGKALKMNFQSHNNQRAVQSAAYVSQEQYTNNSRNIMKAKFKPK